MVEVEDSLDGVEWICSTCPFQKAVTAGSWLEDVCHVRLKEIIPILYCWSRNYPNLLCYHEMVELVEFSNVCLLYEKCQKLSLQYFNNEISSIGAKEEVVEIEVFHSPSDLHVIGGVERKNKKNVFFRVLPENWTRDDLVTAIVDNIAFGTTLNFQSSLLLDILDEAGVEYLKLEWGISVERSQATVNPIVTSLWVLFETIFENKAYSESSLVEFLFRRRMEAERDPFLFLLSVIAKLHAPS